MLVKFFLQFNFLDRRLKNAKSYVEISLLLFFKFSNFCKISRAPAIYLHSGNKFPSCYIPAVRNTTSWNEIVRNKEKVRIFQFLKVEALEGHTLDSYTIHKYILNNSGKDGFISF
jgi:hypothetical protein